MNSFFLHQNNALSGKEEKMIAKLYPDRTPEEGKQRLQTVYNQYQSIFPETRGIQIFSVPGRTELGGNHTDHQHGCVLAAGVSRDTAAVAARNRTNSIRIYSVGYGKMEICLDDTAPRQEEARTPAAFVRGVAACFQQAGYAVGGFDALISSDISAGSGISSSAAFEVLVGRMISGLFEEDGISPIFLAQAGKYAENHYFGKSCGLMDQMACANGSAIFLDFQNPENPYTEKLPFDPKKAGYALCLVDCGAGHEGLSDEYGAIPEEMGRVAACFGKEVLREVSPDEFFASIPAIRKKTGDRAVLRAVHFFGENLRVQKQKEAICAGDFPRFLGLVKESGKSSFQYLQNIYPSGAVYHQEMGIGLALCERLLGEEGAFRVHGGGFGGTVQAFVPLRRLEQFVAEMEKALGQGKIQVLQIREPGAVRVF